QVETVSTTAPVFGDLDSMTEASAILEAIDQLVPDREPVPQMYRMLVGARQTLLSRPSPVVVPAFLWRLLSAEGLRPQLNRCVSCDEGFDASLGDLAFDVDLGGVVCRACQRGREDRSGNVFVLSEAALELMRDLLEGRLGAVLDEAYDPAGQNVDDPVVNEVLVLATRAFEHHVERRLRSVSIFERR
ncbi:MAG: DNA repair protein RecO, partial [Actinomycetota bacterium]